MKQNQKRLGDTIKKTLFWAALNLNEDKLI